MKRFAGFVSSIALLTQFAACTGPDRAHEEAMNWATGIDVTQTPNGVAIILPESVLFDFASPDLRPGAAAAIDRSAAILARSGKHVLVEGHTDNIGSHADNQVLSEARANAVASALERDGILVSRITIRGYSYDRPVADNSTDDGRTQNRRAEIRIEDESVEKVLGRAPVWTQREAPHEQQQPPGASSAPSPRQLATQNPPAPPSGAPSRFVWPAQGRIADPFVAGKTRGMLVAGTAGAPVKAAADGFVVYAGNAVEAYGPLVIIQHRDGYVTAYAHNGRLLVKSRQAVVQGQPIAEMGAGADGRGLLQFEIRRNAQQLDPQAYLPKSDS